MARPQSTRAIGDRIRGRPARRLAKPNVRSLETAYTAVMRGMVSDFNAQIAEKIYNALEFVGTPKPPKFDDPMDVIERVFAGIRVVMAQYFDKRRLERIATDAALKIDSQNRKQFRNVVKTVLKVDPIMSEPWLMDKVSTFVKQNVSLIKTIPAESLSDIEQMIYRDAERKLSPQEMKKKIQEQFELSESRAELIATDQVLKFNGSLTEARQTGLGVKRYIWRTSDDQRVRGRPGGLYPNARPSHWALDGKVFDWDDPPESGTKGEHLHPGQPIRCRCYAEPVLDDLFKR